MLELDMEIKCKNNPYYFRVATVETSQAAVMARYVYNAALVQNTIDTLHAAVDSLETTDETVEKGIEMIMYANGAEVMDIDFSQITNYHIQVVEYIDAMTNELRRKAQEIEEYQSAPWYKKLFSTIGMGALKIVEGLASFSSLAFSSAAFFSSSAFLTFSAK